VRLSQSRPSPWAAPKKVLQKYAETVYFLDTIRLLENTRGVRRSPAQHPAPPPRLERTVVTEAGERLVDGIGLEGARQEALKTHIMRKGKMAKGNA